MRDETDGLNLCIPGLLETSSCGLQRRHGPLCPVPARRHCPVWSLKVDEQTKCNLGECQVLRRALVPRQISELGKVPLTSILEAANRAKKKMNGSRPCGGLMGGGAAGEGTCSNVSAFTAEERSLHAPGGRGVSPPPSKPQCWCLWLLREEAAMEGLISFHAPLFSLNLGRMLAVDSASQNPYLLQGHTQQCFPGLQSWPGLAQVLGTLTQCPGSLLLCQFVTEMPSNRNA